ncbi:MAG: hypothetical protein J0M34_00725 [Alphaproteobacteria bacterium]|nr:hypothetical protein [Alphaproteobacteria bacterium]
MIQKPNNSQESSERVSQEPVQWMGINLPKPFSDDIRRAQHEWNETRDGVIRALPSGIVNNSTNIFALGHVASELMMFKGNNTTFVPEHHRGTWWRYITEPPVSIVKSVFGSSGTTATFRDLVRPSFYVDSARNLLDWNRASDMDRLKGPLINRWSSRSTFFGFSSVLLSGLVPESKENPQDVQRMAQMAQANPLGYLGERVGNAFRFPVEAVGSIVSKESREQAGGHKREFAGLGLTISGVFSFLSGFRNVKAIDTSISKSIPSNQKYFFNRGHAYGGIITALAGANLLLAGDDDQGWSRYGSIMLARTVTLPWAVYSKYANYDVKANWYTGGQTGFVISNTFSALVGSANKSKDGTVENHASIREKIANGDTKTSDKPNSKVMTGKEIDVSVVAPHQELRAL